MSDHDPARVLRDYDLEPLRRELCPAGGRALVVSGGMGAQPSAAAGSCDAAWIELESLEGIDPAALASGVARALRPGGRLVCVVPGALRVRQGGGARRVGFADWRRAFEPSIEWRRSRAFGLLVPPGAAWPQLHPLTLGLLALGEHVIRRWPMLRALGDWVVHEGVRR